MIKSVRYILIVLVCFLFGANGFAQGLKAFKLPNGLSVFVWEDHTVPDVFGMVVCNVGAKEDPENLTGLAHYLEHVMFKGNEKIGALDWEKEKPLYEQIIAKYDEMAKEVDPIRKKELGKEINKLTIEAGQYGLTNEFSVLTQGMGGYGLNATTSWDRTVFYNSFAPGEIYKWLELNSERLIHPVFRGFQTELETVFEEYNRAENNPMNQVQQFMLNSIFPDHPYSRPVLGYPQHIKNPQLSGLIQFYNEWYAPGNMALILTGNVNTNEILPMIKEKFGRLESHPVPAKKEFPEEQLKGRKELKAKIGQNPMLVLGYYAVPLGHEDEIALDVCASILSNSSRTGLLDKLTIGGDFIYAGASNLAFSEKGRILIQVVPSYDVNQHRYNSLGATEKMILNEIKKLQEGKFEEWLIESVKGEMIRRYDLVMERPEDVADVICSAFYSGQDMSQVLNYKEIVASLTIDKIRETAKKYFGNDYVAMLIEKGKLPKKDRIEKPEYDPLKPPHNVKSDYAKLFELMPVKYTAPKFADFNTEVQTKQINNRSRLFYTTNPVNDIFTLVLKYGVGTEKMPNLDLSVSLMNNAGIMGQMEAQEVKQELSNLGATCNYYVDDSYLYVYMTGFETNLQASCNLLTRQILFPKLDEKQMNALKGNVYSGRMMEQESTEGLSEGLSEYLKYKDKSKYLNRPAMEDILALSIGNLTGEFQRATDYEAEIHYIGSLPFESVFEILNANLPLKQGEKESTSPEVKSQASYGENTIYFIADKDAKQANVYFFNDGVSYDKETDVYRDAFNQYFTGGFGSVITQEIREYRSMAYTAYGYVNIPPVKGEHQNFTGYVGTQADKVGEVLDIYLGLVNNMPQYPDRLPGIKNFLKETTLTTAPHFRDKSRTFESWKLRGYTEDPAKERLNKINNMTFDDLLKYYNDNVKDKPLGIAVIGDPNQIDTKALEKYGKIVKLAPTKLFSEK